MKVFNGQLSQQHNRPSTQAKINSNRPYASSGFSFAKLGVIALSLSAQKLVNAQEMRAADGFDQDKCCRIYIQEFDPLPIASSNTWTVGGTKTRVNLKNPEFFSESQCLMHANMYQKTSNDRRPVISFGAGIDQDLTYAYPSDVYFCYNEKSGEVLESGKP